jgi:hypothetical protein
VPQRPLSKPSTPDDFAAKAAWRPGQERARAEYELSFDRAIAQMDHERTCGSCQKYALPSQTSDRYGQPCPVGRRFHAQILGGGAQDFSRRRDNLRVAS